MFKCLSVSCLQNSYYIQTLEASTSNESPATTESVVQTNEFMEPIVAFNQEASTTSPQLSFSTLSEEVKESTEKPENTVVVDDLDINPPSEQEEFSSTSKIVATSTAEPTESVISSSEQIIEEQSTGVPQGEVLIVPGNDKTTAFSDDLTTSVSPIESVEVSTQSIQPTREQKIAVKINPDLLNPDSVAENDTSTTMSTSTSEVAETTSVEPVTKFPEDSKVDLEVNINKLGPESGETSTFAPTYAEVSVSTTHEPTTSQTTKAKSSMLRIYGNLLQAKAASEITTQSGTTTSNLDSDVQTTTAPIPESTVAENPPESETTAGAEPAKNNQNSGSFVDISTNAMTESPLEEFTKPIPEQTTSEPIEHIEDSDLIVNNKVSSPITSDGDNDETLDVTSSGYFEQEADEIILDLADNDESETEGELLVPFVDSTYETTLSASSTPVIELLTTSEPGESLKADSEKLVVGTGPLQEVITASTESSFGGKTKNEKLLIEEDVKDGKMESVNLELDDIFDHVEIPPSGTYSQTKTKSKTLTSEKTKSKSFENSDVKVEKTVTKTTSKTVEKTVEKTIKVDNKVDKANQLIITAYKYYAQDLIERSAIIGDRLNTTEQVLKAAVEQISVTKFIA